MTTDKAQNIKLEDRNPEELREKLNRVVELVTNIKGDKADILRLNGELAEKKANLVKNQAELKDLEKEVLVKVRKPRALKPALKTPVKGSRKTRKKNYDADLEAVKKLADEQNKLNPNVASPGDPRQVPLDIDKK